MSSKVTFKAAAIPQTSATQVVKPAAKAAESFDSIMFGGSTDSRGVLSGEYVQFLSKEAYLDPANRCDVTRKSNGRSFPSTLLNVISYRKDANGNVVNQHMKWFDPSSLIKRCFPVTATPNDETGVAYQEGLRSIPCNTEFNSKYGQWKPSAMLSDIIENNYAIYGENSKDKVWLGRWVNQARVANEYVNSIFTEISTVDGEEFTEE